MSLFTNFTTPISQQRHRSWLPHGFNFLNSQYTRERVSLEKHIRKIIEQASYKEVTPPSFDFAATFQLTTRNAKHNPIFQLRAREGEDLAVRSDLTVQIIKAIANGRLGGYLEHETLRFFYLQAVFHDYAWGSAHQREILQAGVELVNDKVDNRGRVCEILNLAGKCLASLPNLEPRILYGDIRVQEQLFRRVPKRIRAELSLSFHNKDVARIQALCQQAKMDPYYTKLLTGIPLLFGKKEVLLKLKKLCVDNPRLCALFDEAATIDNAINSDLIFDFSLVRELSYYTGPVFEAYIDGSNEKIFTGGVYDKLFAEFADDEKDCTACGFAINLSLLVEHQIEKGGF